MDTESAAIQKKNESREVLLDIFMLAVIFGYGLVLIFAGIVGQIDPRKNSCGRKLAPVLSLGGVGICFEALVRFYKVDSISVIVTRNASFILSSVWGLASIPGMIGDIKVGLRREMLRKKKESTQESDL
jgi:hypothetical protein